MCHIPEREAMFWDEKIPSTEECLAEFHKGPDSNTLAMLEAVEPVIGRRILDFACGTGVTSAWLATRGAIVSGVDVSTKSIERAREFTQSLGLAVSFASGELGSQSTQQEGGFDRIVGRYALHHVDVPVVVPMLADKLAVGGRAAFLETMDSNPVLRIARRKLVGRFGIPRYGTFDEHPLTSADLAILKSSFGELNTSACELTFLRILDRQVLRFRSRTASSLLRHGDDLLLQLGLDYLSYHQVLTLVKTGF